MPSVKENQALRIALVSVGELYGGVERQLFGLCQYLRSVGHKPLLVLFNDRELAAQVRQIGMEPVILKGRHAYDLEVARDLARCFITERVNVVHAHGYKAVVNCALARRQAQFRTVKTVHGLMEPAHGNPVVWVKAHTYRFLESWATRRLDAAVYYVTNDIANRQSGRLQSGQGLTIHNGIEPLDPGLTSRPADLESGCFNLGIVGRVTAVKGISFALQALAGAEAWRERVRLNIIGTGPLVEALQHETKALGVDHLVRFLGFRRNIYDYLGHIDALMMPSLHEGLPYTLLEAMSLSRPVIASRIGGLAEVLRHGETSLLFNCGDVTGLRDCIRHLVEDSAAAMRLGAAARATQFEQYTLERMGARYVQAYLDVLGGATKEGASDG